ncbi:hypothetical protein LOTGIDRAFT_157569 [Lottia gigantea]|uniref:CBM20 domain-containing protein n=1 Tax=Lottia gigantea TaxID=225164 RepID=V4ABP4_LOTGI|nr:hypothetical protein LOTGIDRAFT_157569 [Lottia gigantea]ESP01389.1 hypothetical protein LOTGIDRAFT_157569 [Lottia gigantea]
MSRLIFRIHHICDDRSAVALMGSLPKFGEWNVNKGLRANQHPEGTWEAEVLMVPGQELEFKWVVLFADGNMKWEDRSNRYIITPIRDTVYTALWNGDMEISEIKSTYGGSALRNRKKDAYVTVCKLQKAVLGTTDDRASEMSEINETYHSLVLEAEEMSSRTHDSQVSPSQYSQTSDASDCGNLSRSHSLINYDGDEEIDENELAAISGTSVHSQLSAERQSLKKTSSLLEEIRANKQKETDKYGSIITVICDLLILSTFVFTLIIICSLVFSVNDEETK